MDDPETLAQLIADAQQVTLLPHASRTSAPRVVIDLTVPQPRRIVEIPEETADLVAALAPYGD